MDDNLSTGVHLRREKPRGGRGRAECSGAFYIIFIFNYYTTPTRKKKETRRNNDVIRRRGRAPKTNSDFSFVGLLLLGAFSREPCRERDRMRATVDMSESADHCRCGGSSTLSLAVGHVTMYSCTGSTLTWCPRIGQANTDHIYCFGSNPKSILDHVVGASIVIFYHFTNTGNIIWSDCWNRPSRMFFILKLNPKHIGTQTNLSVENAVKIGNANTNNSAAQPLYYRQYQRWPCRNEGLSRVHVFAIDVITRRGQSVQIVI
ncbi:hypothetical protein EVAR_18773_1 [Eumeta japonica]|uniref:Uncharacterized protein n=1 Tax=Eumeta variegata TaxID=151549 RepID=A0A4C1UMB9_EUMVA|nr:hypothetical protein EVAR_18773_1 [Eumeta japonica]